jgi:signal transduction histidine kinase
MERPMTSPAASAPRRRWWRYARVLAVPVLLWVLVVVGLAEPVRTWLRGEDGFDRAALEEWLLESRGFRETLPEMVESYLSRARQAAALDNEPVPANPAEAASLLERQVLAQQAALVKREEIHEHLRALGDPPTKMYAGQLPLFPTIYRLEVRLDGEPNDPIAWDSGLPLAISRQDQPEHQELQLRLERATVLVRYQLHAFSKRQRIEQQYNQRLRLLVVLAAAATALGGLWLAELRRRERERERQRAEAHQKLAETDRQRIEEERRRIETERKLLEQRLATQAAERQALELKSQLYAGIGIMAGSYAHNIKNLLVRPNDLLRRCLDEDGPASDQTAMLAEVRHTLGTVTERLQEILRTVRRDPTRSQREPFELNALLRDVERTWRDLARDRWKVDLALELSAGPLTIRGDPSHVQQAVENLLFNARDATFEMRNRRRDDARRAVALDEGARKNALIAAAAWRGRVIVRSRREGTDALVEVSDNGVGMTEEVCRRCTDTFFSTKRDNALFEGHSTGMGLGLSFVNTILEHHQARLEVESAPLHGATFRMRFALAE